MQNLPFNILYVDDEEQNLVSFKAAFRRFYTIYLANNGEEGLQFLKTKEIHLIITDQRMPEMTGVEFLERILEDYPDPVRMILTGFSDIDAIANAINSGRVFRYISKPWNQDELKMTIENAKQLYELQQKNKLLLSDLQHTVNEQEKTLKLFMKYVPEPVVNKALNAKGGSIFKGESRKIAVLFCDLRGFTSLSEEMTPIEVVDFLNKYYSVMSDPIRKYNGIVNQFVGDEIFATFGAPMSYPKNELNAVYCALEMKDKLDVLNEFYKNRLENEVVFGIGINFGEVVAGNLGTEDRLDYSVTGDTVNTGKRIETLSKAHPNDILISEKVYDAVKDKILTKPWGPIDIKGRQGKIQVYQVLGRKK